MSILRTYVDLIERIAADEGGDLRFGPSTVHLVTPEASRAHCLRYTLKHVVRHKRPDYRYRKYRLYLCWALRKNARRMQTTRPLLHLDLGCGPGLFTWVVHDALSSSDYPTLRCFGYDHCENMVALADEIWAQLGTGTEACWHHEPSPLLDGVSQHSPPHGSTLVTFGHVLAQTHDQPDAIGTFVKLISRTLKANSLIVAYDAKGARHSFAAGRKALLGALEQSGCETDMIIDGPNYFATNVTR